MKTASTISFRRKVALLRNPHLVLRSITCEQVRRVLIISAVAAWAFLLYFIVEDDLFDEWKYVPRRVVESCFVCLFCGLSSSVTAFSFVCKGRFTYLKRGCMLFIFGVSVLFLFFQYPELF